MGPSFESGLIWGGSLLLIGLILWIYQRTIRKQERTNLFIQRESVELGIDKPLVQHPLIDIYQCIGCGSCVSACPEGDVLGMVAGKATILNGLRCVGHGRCAQACPVGAVKIGLGDRSLRSDLPILNERLESSRKGIFIAGELGGLGLIKHAVEQGRQAALNCIASLDQTAPSLQQPPGNLVWDLIIIGAGPAGLSAGITAKDHGISVLVLEQSMAGGSMLQYPRKSLALTQRVEIPGYGWLEKPYYAKEVLLDIWQTAVSRAQLDVLENQRVITIDGAQGHFEIKTQETTHLARRIVLAMGRRGMPRKLGAPGESLPKVAYQLIDAVSFTHDRVLVVGGGDSAVEAALALSRQPGNKVTLSYRRGRFFRIRKVNRDRLDAAVAAQELDVIYHSNVSEIRPKEVLLHTEQETLVVPNDFLFILIGGIPPFGLLKKTGIRMGSDPETSRNTTG